MRQHSGLWFFVAAFAVLLSFGCAGAGPPPARPVRGLVREGTPHAVDIAAARERGVRRAFEWQPWSRETFERARQERRFILLDGAAEWCHWCHVMDETTYAHPEVGRILRERFVAIRVDIDARPDLAERYGDWGWPATILLSPDAEEIGKFRGYLPPEELIPILRDVGRPSGNDPLAQSSQPPDMAAPVEALGWIAARAALDMDRYFDPQQGSWGRRQKAPLGDNVSFELRRALHGDKPALSRAIFTLKKQRALIDPVWGGIYQYSAGSTWDEPHYEKLMTFQANNLEAYASAYGLTKDPMLLGDALRIARYIGTFLSNRDGAFLVSQDADVGAHDKTARFVDGHIYYRLDNAHRRALGMPRIDDHVYGHENGLAISALCTLYEAARDETVLQQARRAANLLLSTHVAPDGSVLRELKTPAAPRYLADAASFGRALTRLAEVTGDPAYRDAALRIAEAMVQNLGDDPAGAFWAHTPDPAAAGVFARRDKPFSHNVTAARLLAVLSRISGKPELLDRARRTLSAIATPRGVEGRGRMLGDFLMAIDEVGLFPWMDTPAPQRPAAPR